MLNKIDRFVGWVLLLWLVASVGVSLWQHDLNFWQIGFVILFMASIGSAKRIARLESQLKAADELTTLAALGPILEAALKVEPSPNAKIPTGAPHRLEDLLNLCKKQGGIGVCVRDGGKKKTVKK